jgi:hypothetical protein
MHYCDVGAAECRHDLQNVASDLQNVASDLSHPIKKFINNVADEAKLLLIHIRKVLLLNLGPVTGFPDVFLKYLLVNAGIY